MKITLDVDRLFREGLLSEDERRRLIELSGRETGSLALGGLIGFGVIAVSSGLALLFPSAVTVISLGLAMLGVGVGVGVGGAKTRTNKAISSIMLAVGAMTFSGGVLNIYGFDPAVYIGLAILFAIVAICANSGILMAISPLYVFIALGSWFGYGFAVYSLGVSYPLTSIILFSTMAFCAWWFREGLGDEGQRLAVVFARTCLLLVNLAFWMGSLWGGGDDNSISISPMMFGLMWALALISTGLWAAGNNLRWTVNLCITFGAIHFYTQFFTFLVASPLTLVFSGCLALVIAVVIVKVNKSMDENDSVRRNDEAEDLIDDRQSEEGIGNSKPLFTLPIVQRPRRSGRILP